MSGLIVRQVYEPDYTDAGDLVARVFSSGDARLYEWILHEWLAINPTNPDFNYSHHRIGLLDGRIVTHAVVRPMILRYGSIDLRVLGVGGVCTDADFRGRGYAAALMHDAVAYMIEQGAHLSLLNGGVPGYYGQFGYSPVWPMYHFEVESASAAALKSPLNLREVTPADVPHMAHLYKQHWGGRVAVWRTSDVWLWRVEKHRRRYLRVVDDGHGGVAGYIAARGAKDAGAEVVADTLAAAQTLLANSGLIYQAAAIEQLRWLIPPDDALVYYARQLMAVRVSAEYRRNAGWMARLIDAQAVVEALLPEVSAQARRTMPDFDAGRLQIDCQPDGVFVGLRGARNSAAHLSYREFIQVMFGSLRPAALALRPDAPLHADAVRLLEALFPPRMAALAGWDWF